jgi:hypothetical protein
VAAFAGAPTENKLTQSAAMLIGNMARRAVPRLPVFPEINAGSMFAI